MKMNPKAFAIPILNRCCQNRDSKCFRIYYHSLITLEPFICFHISLIFNLFAYFLTFDPYWPIPFLKLNFISSTVSSTEDFSSPLSGLYAD